MSEDNETIIPILQEMRDILRHQADHVANTLQSFADNNRKASQKNLASYESSQKAYQEAQKAYKRKMEKQIEKIMFAPPWRATVFVISFAVIAICMVVSVILKLIRY
jgi:hypothetical protein